MSIFRNLSEAIDNLNKNINLNITIDAKKELIVRFDEGSFITFIYYNEEYIHYNCIYFDNKKDLMLYLFKFDLTTIQLYGNIKKTYHYKNIPANKIINAWKRYRIRTARFRNDLVLQGLAEYFFHPSRVSFEL